MDRCSIQQAYALTLWMVLSSDVEVPALIGRKDDVPFGSFHHRNEVAAAVMVRLGYYPSIAEPAVHPLDTMIKTNRQPV